MKGNKKKIGEILLERGLIGKKELSIALSAQRVVGKKIGELLVSLGFVTPRQVAETLAQQFGIEYVDLSLFPPEEEALKLIPRNMAERFRMIPLSLHNETLSLGLVDPDNFEAIDAARRLTLKTISPKVIDMDSFRETVEKTYYFVENPIDKKINGIIETLSTSPEINIENVAELLDLLISESLRRNATDIHISPQEDLSMVFYRVDGLLNYGYALPKKVHEPLVSRVKILSGLDIAEQRLPQDGAFTFTFLEAKYDMRVSTVPTIHGENVVIRVLTKSTAILDLDRLGFWEDEVKAIRELFKKPSGIILITGPTGSGKTTTLYSAIREANLLERNMLTVEDPVEYRLPFVRQTQLNERAGYTFSLAGRNFMRQDPDIMLIGEIRDEETAKIATRAAITGHLVLSTLHTNDAVSSIPRLADFGIDRFLLAYSLAAVLSQRLVRRVCPKCYIERSPREEEVKEFGIPENATLREGKGCSYCNETGYLGRTVISEMLLIDEDISFLISEGKSPLEIRRVAREKGMKTLREDGIKKALSGVTTLSEIKRIIG